MHQPVRAATLLSASIALAVLAAGPAAACTHGGGASGGHGAHASAGGHGGSGAGDHHGSYGDRGPSQHDTSGHGGTEQPSYQQGDQNGGQQGDQHSRHCHQGAPTPSTGGSHPTGDIHHPSGPSRPAPAAPTAGHSAGHSVGHSVGTGQAPTHVTAVPATVTVTKTSGTSHAAPSHAGGGLWGTSPATSAHPATTAAHTTPAKAAKAAKTPAGKRSGTTVVPDASVSAPAGTSVSAAPAAVPTSIDAGESGSFLARLAHSPLDLGLVLVGLLAGAAGLVVRLRRTAA